MQKRILSTRIDNVDNDFIVIPKDNNKATYSGKKYLEDSVFWVLAFCILFFGLLDYDQNDLLNMLSVWKICAECILQQEQCLEICAQYNL